jgi:hypothetical protein
LELFGLEIDEEELAEVTVDWLVFDDSLLGFGCCG